MHFCLISVFVAAFVGMFSTAYGQNPQATKEETLEWIKGKIVDPRSYPKNGLPVKNSLLNDFAFFYDECTIQYSFKGDTKGNQVVRFQKVNLKDIESCEISGDSTTVVLKTLYNQKIVRNWWVGESFPAHRTEDTAMQFDTMTIFTTSKLARRLKNAFDHVTPLCGGGKKEEKF